MKATTTKLFTLLSLFMLASVALFAQATFPVAWESKFENEPEYMRYTTPDGKYVIGTTKEDVCVLDGTSGKQIWLKTFMDMAGVKKAADQQVLDEAGVLMFISKQKGNDELFCIDLKTGNKLWANESFNGIKLNDVIYVAETNSFVVVLDKGLVFIDSKTGVEKGSVGGITGVPGRWVYVPEKKQFVIMCYQVNAFKAIGSGFTNHLLCVDVENMKTVWQTTFKGVVEIKKYASSTFSVFQWVAVGVNKGIGSSNVLVDMYTYQGKVIVVFNGIKVFDLASGNKIWEIEFDLSLNRGMAGSTQMYGAVADPLFTEKYVYVTSFEKGRDKALIKYDMSNGTKIWETPIDGRKVIIPNIVLVNGVIVAQIGGYVNLQGEQSSSTGTTYFSKWEWQGPFGLKGYDEATGKLLWETEKFDDRITNVLPIGDNLYVADASSVYSVNVKTGANNFMTETKGTKTGKPFFIFDYNDKINLFCDNGMSSYSSTGALNYAYKLKDVDMDGSELFDNIYFLKNGDGLFAINLENGTETGKYEYMKGMKYGFKEEGKSLFLLGEKKVLKHTLK